MECLCGMKRDRNNQLHSTWTWKLLWPAVKRLQMSNCSFLMWRKCAVSCRGNTSERHREGSSRIIEWGLQCGHKRALCFRAQWSGGLQFLSHKEKRYWVFFLRLVNISYAVIQASDSAMRYSLGWFLHIYSTAVWEIEISDVYGMHHTQWHSTITQQTHKDTDTPWRYTLLAQEARRIHTHTHTPHCRCPLNVTSKSILQSVLKDTSTSRNMPICSTWKPFNSLYNHS